MHKKPLSKDWFQMFKTLHNHELTTKLTEQRFQRPHATNTEFTELVQKKTLNKTNNTTTISSSIKTRRGKDVISRVATF